MIILQAVISISIAISTIIMVLLKDCKDGAQYYAVRAIKNADRQIRRMFWKESNRQPYYMRREMAAAYAASAKKDQMPELPDLYSDYFLYKKYSNVEICTICDNEIFNQLAVGQRLALTVRCIDKVDVVVSADGVEIGFLPASTVRKAILSRRNMKWHEEAYIDSIDRNGGITLLIGIYKLNKLTKIETERHAQIDLLNASLAKSA